MGYLGYVLVAWGIEGTIVLALLLWCKFAEKKYARK